MQIWARFIIIVFALCFSVNTVMFANTNPDEDIVIIYDNDVHGAFHGYAKIAALKRETSKRTPYVMLASMGDFAQGGPLCSVSKGLYAIQVMNKCGYDIVTLGNHEFDYGLSFLDVLKDSLQADIVLDNFTDLRTGESVFSATAIKTFGNTKIGFIGAVTPMTQSIDSPKSYVDEDGTDIYTFHRNNFFIRIQNDIDLLKKQGADYVILFSHLGDNPFDPITSESTVSHTHGLNAVIDGHAHHIIPERWLFDMQGNPVILASTGCDFQNIGRLAIKKEGIIVNELIPTYDVMVSDNDVANMVKQMDASINVLPPFASTPFPLVSYAVQYNTYDRNCITNLGRLVSDAFREMTGADIGWVNSGSLRVGIPSGDITYRALLATFPHQNNICVSRFKGSRLLDALEFGVQRWPKDYGAFPVLSGMKFQIDTTGVAVIERDSIGMFLGIGKGKRRIANVQVYNRQTAQYEPLNPDRFYTVASNEYNLKHHGDGGILSDGELIQDAQMKDVQLVQDYILQYLNGVIPQKYIKVRSDIEVVSTGSKR